MTTAVLPTITVPANVGDVSSPGVLASSLSSMNRTFNYTGLMPGDTLDLQGANADVPSDYATIQRTTYSGSAAISFTIVPENSVYYRVQRVQKGSNDPGTGRTLIVSGTLASGTDASPDVIRDKALTFIAGGTTDCTTDTQVATGQSGGGYLTVVNDSGATIFLGITGVTSSTGMRIPAGQSDTAWYVDVSTMHAIGASTVGWGLRR